MPFCFMTSAPTLQHALLGFPCLTPFDFPSSPWLSPPTHPSLSQTNLLHFPEDALLSFSSFSSLGLQRPSSLLSWVNTHLFFKTQFTPSRHMPPWTF